MEELAIRDMVSKAAASLDKHKAENIRVIRVSDVTVVADYFVIANGTSTTQVRALGDYLEEDLRGQGITPLRTDGYRSPNWIALDYGAMIVHIFLEETRDFYDLERLWKDGEPVPLSDLLSAGAQGSPVDSL